MKENHSFSVQLKGKEHVKCVNLADKTEVLIEGYLGELESLGIIEEAVVEIKGSKGVLRVDLTRSQLMQLLEQEKDKS